MGLIKDVVVEDYDKLALILLVKYIQAVDPAFAIVQQIILTITNGIEDIGCGNPLHFQV